MVAKPDITSWRRLPKIDSDNPRRVVAQRTRQNCEPAPIDYRASTVEEYVEALTQGQGFDLVADTVGGASLDASFKAVKQFGHVVSALGWGTHALAPLSFREATYSGVFTLSALLTGKHREHHGDMLRIATQLIEAGKILPKLDSRSFDLSNVELGYQAIVEATNTGKIIVGVE